MPEPKEPVIIVDDQDNQVAVMERAEAEKDEKNILRYVYVLLFNHEEQLLLQKRAAQLERFPNYWEVSASGAVWPGEGYVQAAERKLPDELNMKVPLFHEHKSVLPIPGKADRMTAVFVGYARNNELVQPNLEKVDEVRWVTTDEALKGYLLTPSCEFILRWWLEHGKDVMANVKEQSTT